MFLAAYCVLPEKCPQILMSEILCSQTHVVSKMCVVRKMLCVLRHML